MSTSTLTDTCPLTTSSSRGHGAARIARAIARAAVPTARVLLGLVFFVCGLDGFIEFLPRPTEPISGAALQFAGGLVASGYFFPLLKGTELIAGALLLSNRFVPLALAILAPVVIHIVAFHWFLTPGQVTQPIVLLTLELGLAWSYRAVYRSMLTARATPNV